MSRRWWRVALALLLAVLVLLPGPGSAARAAQLIHVVQPDETLESIARRYGIDPSTLAERNNLSSPYTLQAGQTLLVAGTSLNNLPMAGPQAVPRPAPVALLPPDLALLPTPGLALHSIARRYGTGGDLVHWLNPLASLTPLSRSVVLIPVRAPAALAPPRQACTEWPAAGEALVARVNGWAIGLGAFERR